MKRVWLVLLAGALFAWNASAQTSGSSQTSTSAKSKTSVSADKSGAQVQSDTSVTASQETKASREQSDKKGSGAQASSSTSASAQAGDSSASLAAGTTIDAVLLSLVDARRNKQGDQVVARATKDVKSNGEVVIPKGSKLIGHVTQAKARAKGQSESELGIVFDHAFLKNGQEMPVHVVIQALAAAQTATSASLSDSDLMSSTSGMGSATGSGRASTSGGGLLSSAGSTVGAAAGAVTNTAGAVGNTVGGAADATANTAASATGAVAGSNATGMLNSSSTGVIGLKGLSLNSQASNATQGALIVSSTRNVHLDSGTQLLLRAENQ